MLSRTHCSAATMSIYEHARCPNGREVPTGDILQMAEAKGSIEAMVQADQRPRRARAASAPLSPVAPGAE